MSYNFDSITVEFIILLIFAASAIIQLIYYWGFFSRLAFAKNPPSEKNIAEPVSVVICAHNEYFNLKRNLPLILEQDYSDFEVIVIIHCSEDDSEELLKDLGDKHKNLKTVIIQKDLNFFRGKKFPLAIGIKSAKNDIILLTDADCKPASRNWLSLMQARFNDKNRIVLGYGAYHREKGFLNRIICFDTFHVALQYLSFAMAGVPYMGVGRNLAYRKSLFYEQKGFSAHYHLPSGDDDLFINSCANRDNTGVEFDEQAHTVSIPKNSFKSWIIQKRRHLSTGQHYKKNHFFLLSLYGFTQFSFYTTFIYLLALVFQVWIVAGIFILRWVTQLIIFKKAMNKLNEKKLLLLSPIMEIFLIVLFPLLSITNLFTKPVKWS